MVMKHYCFHHAPIYALSPGDTRRVGVFQYLSACDTRIFLHERWATVGNSSGMKEQFVQTSEKTKHMINDHMIKNVGPYTL